MHEECFDTALRFPSTSSITHQTQNQQRIRIRIHRPSQDALLRRFRLFEALVMNHETFSRNTRNQLQQIFDALRELMQPPYPPKRPIGFINPEDTGSKKTSGARGKA